MMFSENNEIFLWALKDGNFAAKSNGQNWSQVLIKKIRNERLLNRKSRSCRGTDFNRLHKKVILQPAHQSEFEFIFANLNFFNDVQSDSESKIGMPDEPPNIMKSPVYFRSMPVSHEDSRSQYKRYLKMIVMCSNQQPCKIVYCRTPHSYRGSILGADSSHITPHDTR